VNVLLHIHELEYCSIYKQTNTNSPAAAPIIKGNFYKRLSVSRGDKTSDIKRAFRDISRKIHPDKVPESQKKDAEEKFRYMSVGTCVSLEREF